jgi:transglutaminase-like putative cysteine protease
VPAHGLPPRSLPGVARARATAAVLVVGLVAATTWAVMVADWVDGTGVTLVSAVAAALEGVLVARALVGRLVAAVAAPLLGLIVIVLLTLGSMPADGGEGLHHVALRYAGALAGGLFQSDDWTFLVGLSGVMWLVGFWSAWLAIREHRGVLAVLPAYAVLAVNALNAPTLEHVLLPEALAVGLSLLVVTDAHLADLERGWRRRRVIALPGTARSFARLSVAATGVVVLLALVTPPLTTVDVSGRLFHVGSGPASHDGMGGLRGGGAVDQQAPIQFAADTRPGGPLVSDPRPVLSYTSDRAEGVYLRVVNDTVFDRGNWYYCDPGALTRLTLGSLGAVPLDTRPASGALGTAERPVRLRIVLDGVAAAAQRDAIFPGEPLSVTSGGRVPPGSATSCVRPGAGAAGGLLTVDRVPLRHGVTSMDTVGLVPTATEPQLRSAGEDDPAWARELTELPTGGPDDERQKEQIATLARAWTHGLTTRYDQAAAIEQMLRSTQFTYTLDPPRPPRGVWPITYFLLSSHQGYCQYFASSMATMLRTLGIPARVVAGYGGGALADRSPSSPAVTHRVSTTDAHNWVEAYFPHYGWIPFEPTPPSDAAGDYEPFARGTVTAAADSSAPLAPPPTRPQPPPTPAPDTSSSAALPDPRPGAPAALVALVAAAALLAGLGVAGWRWLAAAPTGTGLRRRISLLGLALGVRRRPSDTDAGFVRRLVLALPSDTTTLLHRDGSAPPGPRPLRDGAAESLLLVAALCGKERFSREGLLPAEVVRRRRAWLRVCRAAPALLWRRLLSRSAPGDGAALRTEETA